MAAPVLEYGYDVNTPATAPVLVMGMADGDLSNAGPYSYAVTYRSAFGETLLGPASAPLSTTTGSIEVKSIPLPPNSISQRSLYRTTAGGVVFFLLAEINNPFQTTYTDLADDSTLSVPAPIANNAHSLEITRGFQFYSQPITSLVTTGTPPFVVNSTTVVTNLTAENSVNAANIATTQVADNALFYPLMVASFVDSNQPADLSAGLTYNPFTNILTTTGIKLTGLTASSAVVTDGSNNLASLSYTPQSTASTIVSRDANVNTAANNFITNIASTVTSVGVTVLNVSSAPLQVFTGAFGQFVDLPDTSTLPQIGVTYTIINKSIAGFVSVRSFDGNVVFNVVSLNTVRFSCLSLVDNSPAGWVFY